MAEQEDKRPNPYRCDPADPHVEKVSPLQQPAEDNPAEEQPVIREDLTVLEARIDALEGRIEDNKRRIEEVSSVNAGGVKTDPELPAGDRLDRTDGIAEPVSGQSGGDTISAPFISPDHPAGG